MVERLITPSKITAWLECSHFLSLRNRADAGTLLVEPRPLGSLADLLIEKGAQHERNCLQELEDQGRSVYQVPGRNPDETFPQWVARIGNPMEKGHDVIYQMPLVHEGIRGIADFLVRVDGPEGYCTYEPVDAKLTRIEGKPGHVLQLCFYADALEALTGLRAEHEMPPSGSGREFANRCGSKSSVRTGAVSDDSSPLCSTKTRSVTRIRNRARTATTANSIRCV